MARCASAVQRESKEFYALVEPALLWEAACAVRNSESTPSELLLHHERWLGHSAIRFYCTI
eukprot:10573610-Alexandrium_andersonii.AAC.1